MRLHTFLHRAGHTALALAGLCAVSSLLFIALSAQLTGLLLGIRLATIALVGPVCAAALFTGSAWSRRVAWARQAR